MWNPKLAGFKRIVKKINALGVKMEKLTEEEMRKKTEELKGRAVRGEPWFGRPQNVRLDMGITMCSCWEASPCIRDIWRRCVLVKERPLFPRPLPF